MKAVAEFQAVDGDVTLPALLAYLEAEDDFGNGLDVATPTDADSVKLLTVHRAKGLEWDVVFLVGVAAENVSPPPRRAPSGPPGPGRAALPAARRPARPPVAGRVHRRRPQGVRRGVQDPRAPEELRLGYVALTRARHELVVSSYCWSPTRKGALGPSPYQVTVKEALEEWGEKPEQWLDRPAKDEVQPAHRAGRAPAVARPGHTEGGRPAGRRRPSG